jgi:CRISPR-associated protein Cmr5
MQTLQQLRAKYALDKVTDLVPLNEGDKLKGRASELPFMIHANGLGQAAAFFKSKKDKDGYDKLFIVLQGWLSQPGRPFAGQTDLMRAITEADMHQYRVAQAEAIQFMDWVKKFASAYL